MGGGGGGGALAQNVANNSKSLLLHLLIAKVHCCKEPYSTYVYTIQFLRFAFFKSCQKFYESFNEITFSVGC